jgi:hypothetical protein
MSSEVILEPYRLSQEDQAKFIARRDVIHLPFESIPSLTKGMMMYQGFNRTRGRVKYANRESSSEYFIGDMRRYNGEKMERYTLTNGNWSYWTLRMENPILYNDRIYNYAKRYRGQINISSGNVLLEKSLFEAKTRRSCYLCVSDCKNRVCPLYDPITNYLSGGD